MPKLNQQKLEAHLWGAANILRGRTAGQDYKTYILSLMFFKRLSNQWQYEAEEVIRQKEQERGRPFTEAQRANLVRSSNIHRFDIPKGCHWEDVLNVSENIGQKLNEAMRGIAAANKELVGVFTVDWNLPAPDGVGKLIPNTVVSALVQHFNKMDLSNASAEPDVLGRAYEYLIKQFADDAGAKAGEFFTPPEVVDTLIRILEPQPGETVYDPTCGSGGMLVHSADFLKEQGYAPDQLRYFGQEMNWATYAIARINMILHGLEADIRGGQSTITDPQHLDARGRLRQFKVVIANFPFSDSEWYLPDDQRTEEQIKKAKKQKSKDGYQDRYGRFVFGQPPAQYGDFAFIQHILASTSTVDDGRCGVVCPQGVLFRGQPEMEYETGEFDEEGQPIIRRRKADDEHIIRMGLLEKRLIDAIIALPLNVFYGAGVPACLLILKKKRPVKRRNQVLFVYAARHYRELSNKNQLRPHDVMRILVHYHAYGNAKKAAKLAAQHSRRLQAAVTQTEEEDIARIVEEFRPQVERLAQLQTELVEAQALLVTLEARPSLPNGHGTGGRKVKPKQPNRIVQEKKIARLQDMLVRQSAELAKRDEQIADARKQAEDERQANRDTGTELIALYDDPAELAKHTRVVEMSEIEENEYNLNVPRYVDTFEPEEPIDINEALRELDEAEKKRKMAERLLNDLLHEVGYAAN